MKVILKDNGEVVLTSETKLETQALDKWEKDQRKRKTPIVENCTITGEINGIRCNI